MSKKKPSSYQPPDDEEVLEWWSMTPAQRWAESHKLWATFLALGGSLDPEPDHQSPFYDPEALWLWYPAHPLLRITPPEDAMPCQWPDSQTLATQGQSGNDLAPPTAEKNSESTQRAGLR